MVEPEHEEKIVTGLTKLGLKIRVIRMKILENN